MKMEKSEGPRDVMLFPHQTPTGHRCGGRACGALVTRGDPAIRGGH